MRALIVDHDPAVLESATRMLEGLIDTVTATSKSECAAHLRAGGIGVIVACERLADGSGLDLLARVHRTDPGPLRIFAADLERVKMLGSHLAPFDLFDTISYPLESLQLKSVIALAIAARGDVTSGEYENVVMGSDEPARSDTDDIPFASAAPAPLAPPPSVVVLTRDASSLEAANAALAGKPYHLIAARDADEARADLSARQPIVALIDCGMLGDDAAGWYGRARTAAPQTLLLALGRRDDGQRLESLVASGVVNRFVSKPVTAAGMRLVLDSALRQQALAASRTEPAPEGSPSNRATPAADDATGDAAVIAPAISSWVSNAAAATAYSLEPLPDNALLRSLARPRTALVAVALGVTVAIAGMLLSSDGSDEADAQSTAERRDSPDTQATLAATTVALVDDIEAALTRDDTAGARRALDELTRVNPAYPRITLLTTLVTRAEEMARMAGGTDAAPVTAPRPANPNPAPTPTRTDLPARDDAPASPPQRASAPAQPVVEPTTLRPGKITPVSFAGRTLEESNQPVAVDATPPPPAERDAGPEPVVLDYKVLKRVAPDYPPDAHRRGIEGSVDVMFTVTSNGRASDVRVVASNPPRIFDREAMDAVRRWRFDPRYEDGIAVDTTAKVRLEFRLDD